MAYPTEVLADSPIGYWRLDETSGSTAADSSGNGRDGTIVGGVTLGDLSCPTGAGMVFNGSTGYIDIGIQSAFGFTGATDPFTIEAWVLRRSDSGGNTQIISNGDLGWTARYGANYWEAVRRHTSGWQAVLMASGTAPAETWCHFVWTYDGTTLRTYVNGVAGATGTNTNDTNNPGLRTLIGAMPEAATQSRFYKGKIADCAVYNTALSPARILAHYRAGIAIEATANITLDPITLVATDIYEATADITLDPITLAATGTAFVPIDMIMPGIDGAVPLLGIDELKTAAITLPTIDGAEPVVGPILGLAEPAEIEMPSIDGEIEPLGIDQITTTGTPAPPDYRPTISAQILASDGTTVLATVFDYTDLSWTDSLNETGNGTITIPLSVSASAQLAAGRYVRCRYRGVAQFTFLIEGDPQISVIARGEEFDEVVTATGRGWVAILDQIVVYPYKGIDNPLNPQYRTFNFASFDFPNSGGFKPVALQGKAGDVLIDLGRYVIGTLVTPSEDPDEDDLEEPIDLATPVGFPDKDANWIWPSKDPCPAGRCYFRRRFTIVEEGEYQIAASGDNFYTVYLEGTPIIGEDEVTSCWMEYKTANVYLEPGQYQLAAVVENIRGKAGVNNPGGFVLSLYNLTTEGEINQVVCRTDADWRGIAYPKEVPGWTAGQIVRTLIAEARDRGMLNEMWVTFTNLADSEGSTWGMIPQFSVPVGSTFLDVVTNLASEGWVDYRIRPGFLRLEMFIANNAGTNSGVTFVEGQDIEELSINETEQFINTLLVKWPRGYFEQQDLGSVGTYGRREGFATFDVPTKAEAQRRARTLLASLANPDPTIAMSIIPVDGKRPYVNFKLGDTITTPTASGGTGLFRVWSISMSSDDMGNPNVTLEVGRRLRLRQREFISLIENIGSGIMGELTAEGESDIVVAATPTPDRLE